MKNLLVSIVLFLSVTASFGQTAAGGCTSVTVTNGVPSLNNLYLAGPSGCGFQVVNACDAVLRYCQPAETQYRLLRYTGTSWSVVRQWQTSTVFNTLGHGTYRVAARAPEVLQNSSCSTGRIKVFNLLGQVIGYMGTMGNTTYSNQVVVGATEQSDIAWSFVDPNGNNLFDPSQPILMNTTGTKNYDHWWVAIFENGGQNRYWSNGWTNGPIPNNEIDLTALASSLLPFGQIPVSYTVQFAISAGCNTAWTNLDKDFVVCPSGFGCRSASPDMEKEPIFMTMDASGNSFELHHLDTKSNTDRLRVMVVGMDGKTVKSYEDFSQVRSSLFDISELASGIYIITVFDGTDRLFADKLSVER